MLIPASSWVVTASAGATPTAAVAPRQAATSAALFDRTLRFINTLLKGDGLCLPHRALPTGPLRSGVPYGSHPISFQAQRWLPAGEYLATEAKRERRVTSK